MTREEELDYQRKYAKKRYENNKAYFKEKSYKWKKENPEGMRVIKRRYRIKLKTETLSHYGNLVCKNCKETILEMLSLDHVNGGGNNHRREIGVGNRSGTEFYAWLKKNNYPNNPLLQILCLHCNKKKH